MKKRILAGLLAALMLFTWIAPTAAAAKATPEKVYITVESNGNRYTQHAYKSGSTLFVPVTMLTQFGGMRYSADGSNYTFYYKAETANGGPIGGARRIFLNVGKKTVQSVYYPTSSRYVTVTSASLSDTYTANKEHYIPLEELLPLLDAKVEIGKDGIVHIQSNPMPLFRALRYARPDLITFDMNQYFLGDVVSATGLVIETIMGRYDRLDIINGSGAVKDYSSLFKKFLTLNETYMAAFDKAETPIDKGIKEITGAASDLKSALSGTKDMLTLAEYMSTSSQHDTYKEFSNAVGKFKGNAKAVEGAIKVIKFADTYINQIEDHRNMLNAVYSGGSAPAARAANEIYTLYGKDAAAQLTSAGVAALRDYVSGEVAGLVNKGAGLKPYTIAFSAVKLLLPDAMKTFSESAELFYLDKIVEDAKAAAEKGLNSEKMDKTSLENLRLSLIMCLVAVKHGYDTYGAVGDSEFVNTWLEMLYLAADSVECVSSGYYATKKAELKKMVSSVKTTNGSTSNSTTDTTTTTTTTSTTTKQDIPDKLLASGKCGPGLIWKITTDGEEQTLTISGKGEMDDFKYYFIPYGDYRTPWECVIDDDTDHLFEYSYVADSVESGDQYINIEKLVIEEGVASIGRGAFEYADYIGDTLIIPEGVVTIGDFAFQCAFNVHHSSVLAKIIMPASITKIGVDAFEGNLGCLTIVYQGTKKQWEAIEQEEDWFKDWGGFITVACTDGDLFFNEQYEHP